MVSGPRGQTIRPGYPGRSNVSRVSLQNLINHLHEDCEPDSGRRDNSCQVDELVSVGIGR